jgi:hypothetical protein
MEGAASAFFSYDRPLAGENTGVDVSIEFINNLIEGMSPHELILKKGDRVIILRNMGPTNGMCNGTRLIVDKVIEGTVLRATVVGNPTKVALTPRMKLIPNTRSFPFQWSKR